MLAEEQPSKHVKHRQRHAWHVVVIAMLMAFCLSENNPVGAAQKQDKPTAVNDVRVLIDISGSMKKNDPENLRQPALKLLVSLLPNDTLAGVWTFGQWVNMLIPHGKVSKSWKTSAQKSIKQINSVGLYTNIEDALRRSTWDWVKNDETSKRSLILLTDGFVDISKQESENHLSRQRILQEVLPLLQKANVAIHAIALSEDSDHNLLKQLATATGGKFETIKTAEGLERLFLHLFDSVASADSLPLKENRVKVDDSINEMTFLIFSNNNQGENSITSPSGNTYNFNKQHKEMAWHKEKNYDLVTIQKPKSGYWKINAPIDPDNRVMVVTDLKLISTKLPSILTAGSMQPFHIHLEENGKVVDRRDFLYFVKATINQSSIDENNKENTWKIKLLDDGKGSDEKSKDGIYSAMLDESITAGEHDIEVSVNGTTFRRYARQKINVYTHPATANIEKTTQNTFKVSILPYKNLIDPDVMRVKAIHKSPNEEITESNVPRVSPAEWAAEFSTEDKPGKHEITITLIGNNDAGDAIDVTLDPLTIIIEGVTTPKKDNAKPEKNDAHEEPESPINWLVVTIKIVLFNLVIIIILFLLYKFWPTIRRKIIPALTEETVKEAENG